MAKYIRENAVQLNEQNDPLSVIMETTMSVMPCPLCGFDMNLKKHNNTFYLSCSAYPACKSSIWFPSKVALASVSSDHCPTVSLLFCFNPMHVKSIP